MVKILNYPDNQYYKDMIPIVLEKYKGSQFVCETCIRSKPVSGNWLNSPWLIFYQEIPHPKGSNYFALGFSGFGEMQKLSITNGISATEKFQGVIDRNGNVIYSRFRHDYRVSNDGNESNPSTFVDGGRDYVKTNSPSKIVKLQINKNKLEVVI